MTKLISGMTTWDFEQFALTEQVNPSGWQIWSARILNKRLLISVGFYDAGGWPTPFDVLDIPVGTNQSWEEFWRGLIEQCDHENENRGAG